MDKYLRVSVTYTDPQGPGKTADAVTSDTVLAEPNSVPQFSDETVTRSVAENTPAGTNIGVPITADDTTGDTLDYSLDSDDGDSFSIIRTSGQLRTKDDLDYERKASYSVTVAVTDSASAVAEVPVTIAVTNVEEEGKVTLSSVQPQVGTALTATLTDPDGSISGETWKWEISSNQTSWAPISGATSASYTPVTSNVGKYLRVTASYTDGEGSGKSAQYAPASPVRVRPATVRPATVRPTNNAAPSFPATENGARSVAENTRPGRNIGAPVDATDPNANDTLTYSKSGTDAAAFNIVSNSGQLRTKDDLDYERKASYSVTVTVTDSSSAVAEVPVTITVTNVEEAGEVTLSSTQPQVGTALTATLADPDVVSGSPAWRWTIASSATGTFNNVSNEGTSASYTPVAGDVGKYLKVTASYSDGEGFSKSAEYSAPTNPVRVRPANNAAPSFPATENGARSVAENTPAGRNIGAPVDATDPNANDTLTYSKSGTDAAAFDIVSTSGQLRTKDPLNYERKSSYSVTVTVTDSASAVAEVPVTITVTNVEEAGDGNAVVDPTPGRHRADRYSNRPGRRLWLTLHGGGKLPAAQPAPLTTSAVGVRRLPTRR